jgi:AraC-like DNA-binding protein
MDTPTASVRTIEIAIATAAADAGTTVPSACARAGVDPSILGDPAGRVPHETVERVWDTLAAGDEAFGLRAARRVETMGRSVFEYAMLNAADVRGVLRTFLRLQRMMHDASAHALEERADAAVLRIGLVPPLRLPLAASDFIAAMLVLRFRVLLRDPVEPVEVRLCRPPPAAPTPAPEIFGAKVAYGSPRVEVHWPRAALDRAFCTSDPTLHLVLTREIERALGLPAEPRDHVHGRPSDDVDGRVRRALRVALARGDSSLGVVARMLAMSGRSLERRLSAQGTSFQDVRDGVRRSIAEELLVARGANVTEAALAAGFSEVAAFTRAFRRWTGMAPSEFLRARAAAAGARPAG